MIITERTSDGTTIVKIHKDWNPSRISAAYIPSRRSVYADTDPRNADDLRDASRLQRALLSKSPFRTK